MSDSHFVDPAPDTLILQGPRTATPAIRAKDVARKRSKRTTSNHTVIQRLVSHLDLSWDVAVSTVPKLGHISIPLPLPGASGLAAVTLPRPTLTGNDSLVVVRFLTADGHKQSGLTT